MFVLRTSGVLLLFLLARAEVIDFDEKNELCYTCTCNSNGSDVDCSRRGLIDVPDGSYDKVLHFLPVLHTTDGLYISAFNCP